MDDLPEDMTADQYAALPYRRGKDGALEILLITSRGSGQWIIPKGKPIAGLSPAETAAQEAFEEAGIRGRADPASIGRFSYVKDEGQVSEREVAAVDVFALEVEQQLTLWPEMGQRQILWLDPADAAAVIQIEALRHIVIAFAAGFRRA
ncbi:NUDIX hydrolase [Asticcacaulis sp. AND118]|uniref:NUDIX hydrolase n=1 Tax=Asticcacaulis sp. AND118 TaxID=2840468 RepID=UPI001CFFDC49|nr:NUDIX hydrolase [Asticcacaulis sp. AND118]UDF03058.1 NUDIX hydrolase [Asticcacaulis sp. AND118]